GFYLAGYPILAVGLLLLVRHRSTGSDWGSLIDATMLAVAVGVVAWGLLIVPFTHDNTLSVVVKAFSIAYPLCDVLLLALAARLLLGGGERTISYGLLVLGIVSPLLADSAYTYLSLHGTVLTGNGLDVIWLLSYLFWGAAALHPSMRSVAEPAPES